MIGVVLISSLLALVGQSAGASPAPNPNASTPAGQVEHELVNFQVHVYTGERRKPVPLEIVKGTLVIPVEVAGKGAWAVLDNRQEASLIDLAFAQQAGLAIGPEAPPIRTPTGLVPRRKVYNVPVVVPGQADFIAPFSAVDLGFVSKMSERPVALVLGREYFQILVFLFSPSKHLMQLGPSGSATAHGPMKRITLLNDRPQVDIAIGGQNLRVTVDLGFNGGLGLSPDAWRKVVPADAQTYIRQIANLNGIVSDASFARLPNATVGDLVVDNIEASRRPTLVEDADGLIGTAIFGGADFFIDLKARTIGVVGGAAPSAP
jgi:hypothetical protein